MLFTRLILRPLLTHRMRTWVTIFGVALGVAVMLGIQLANSASMRGFSAAIDTVSGRASLEIISPPVGLDEKELQDISWLREYGIVTPVMDAEVLAETARGSETLKVLGIDVLRDPALRDYSLASSDSAQSATGLQLMSLLAVPDTLLLTQSFANRYGLTKGSALRIVVGDRVRECRVTGVIGASTSSQLADQSLAIMDIANAQVALDRLGWIDRLELRLHEGVSITNAEQKVRQRAPPGWTIQRPQRRTEAVEKMLTAFHFNLTMLSGIALVVGLFLIYNTVSVSVMNRRREIGMLRTLGVTRGQILRLFFAEALVLSLAGAALGIPLAKALATAAVSLTSTTVNALYVAQSVQVPELTWIHWLAGIVIALPLAVIAAIRPALEASRVTPVEAMAASNAQAWEEPAAKGGVWLRRSAPVLVLVFGAWCATRPPVLDLPLWGYVSALCAVIAASLAVPDALKWTSSGLRSVLGCLGIEGRLAVSQIRASQHRLSISVAALSVSLALTIAIAIMVGSFRQTVLYWVDQTMGADLYVRPATPTRNSNPPSLSEQTLATLRNHPQVAALDAYHSLDLPFQDRLIKLAAGDYKVMIEHGRLAFKTRGDPQVILRDILTNGAVIASESFALRFHVSEGSLITLPTPAGPQSFRLGGIVYDYSNDRGTLTLDRSVFGKFFGESRPTHVALYLKPDAKGIDVRDELLRELDGKARVMIFTNASLRAEVLRIFDSTFAITWALEIIAVFVAMAGVGATMLTLVLERQKEIRLLRLAGADAGQVRRTIMLESGILGLVSQGLGIVIGLLLSLVLIHVINPQSFGWSIRFHVSWWFLLLSSFLTIAGTMLAGLYPAWRITRQPLQALDA